MSKRKKKKKWKGYEEGGRDEVLWILLLLSVAVG
jgi:hypothetical protein